MAVDIVPNFCQSITYSPVGVEQLMMFVGVPFGQGWKLLRDGKEQIDDNTDRGRLHVMTELIDNRLVLCQYQPIQVKGMKD